MCSPLEIAENTGEKIVSKVVIRTGDVKDFFARAQAAAQKADRGEELDQSVTFSFEDPTQMFTVLSEARRKLMHEVMREPKTINQLVEILNRDRSSIVRDIEKLEALGLLVSRRQAGPGHGSQKVVQSVAQQIELLATLS